jgi:hypothetical protein
MSVLIQKSKTDIHRDRNRIIIAGTGDGMCPSNTMNSLIDRTGPGIMLHQAR